MSYVKTNWQNDQAPAIDATNLNKIETGIAESRNVALLAVDSTAPAHCSEGDLYYNTTTKKIYEAIDTDVWDSTGVDPIGDILYIIFSTKTTYSYDGTDLVSVGGGGAEVSVSTTQPIEDEILWINPEDIPSGTGFELNKFYPVGSIYINTTGVNPSTFMGGTWQSFGAGRVLVGQDTNDTDFDTLLETGGSKELQEHTHNNRMNTLNKLDSGYGLSSGGAYSDRVVIRQNETNTNVLNDFVNIQSEGTGNSGNLQPYIVVSMWVRTA